MAHIFCESSERRCKTFQEIFKIYDERSTDVVARVDSVVSQCKECLEAYLKLHPAWEFEKRRIQLNFSPEKIYDWKHLLDDEIRSEYRARADYPQACQGFKAVVFLIGEGIENDKAWQRIDLRTVQTGEKEVEFLKSGRGACFTKARQILNIKGEEESVGPLRSSGTNSGRPAERENLQRVTRNFLRVPGKADTPISTSELPQRATVSPASGGTATVQVASGWTDDTSYRANDTSCRTEDTSCRTDDTSCRTEDTSFDLGSAPSTASDSQTSRTVASLISERSSSLFAATKPSGKKNVEPADPSKEFFSYVLNPFRSLPEVKLNVLPKTFDSYQQYFSLFNPLQICETVEAIKSSIFENSRYLNCTIRKAEKNLIIDVASFPYEAHDLLYFSRKRSEFHQEIVEKKGIHPSGGFFGVVLQITPGMSNGKLDAVDIKVLPETLQHLNNEIKKAQNQTMVFRHCRNISTSYREHLALKALRNSTSLKYLLKPSFTKDYYEGNVTWDQNKLCYVKKSSNLEFKSNEKQDDGCRNALFRLLMKAHKLNDSQANAVVNARFTRENFHLILGPPGTGKTTTILSLISTFLFADVRSQRSLDRGFETSKSVGSSKILVCASSNIAVDVIVHKLAKGLRNFDGDLVPVQFLRIGARADPDVERYRLECIIGNLSGQHKLQVKQTLIANASVICSTLSSCASDYMTVDKFDLVIVDEACQATEISTLMPLRYNPGKVIMIGDTCQLPPTVFSKRHQLYESLFERMLDYHVPEILNTQYRMHPAICDLASTLFYKKKLKTSSDTAAARRHSPYKFRPINFVEIGNSKEEMDALKTFSNAAECAACLCICRSLVQKYGRDLKIVILTPYKGQANLLLSHPEYEKLGVEVSTIDGFQGKECDIVILSTVRRQGLGFVCDFRRINVAVTRSRECLIILGSRKCLSKSPQWSKLIKHIETSKDGLVSQSPQMLLKRL